jgi:hypothetical protein
MRDLVLRPTIINNRRYRNDYIVVWKSDFGERRVGRIQLTEGSAELTWVYNLQADIAVPPWANGHCRTLKAAQAKFRAVFERYCSDAGDLSKAFRTPP